MDILFANTNTAEQNPIQCNATNTTDKNAYECNEMMFKPPPPMVVTSLLFVFSKIYNNFSVYR